MNEHVDNADLEAFVLGDLDEARAARFEQHCSACASCAERLANEARFELALVEVQAAASSSAPRRGVRAARGRWRTVTYAAVATLALAAALALVVRRTEPARPSVASARPATIGAPIAPVVCPAGTEQGACVDRAHRHGLVVRYPGWAGPPPIGGGARSAGPSNPPFLSESTRP